jgi:hypothetical protein
MLCLEEDVKASIHGTSFRGLSIGGINFKNFYKEYYSA